MGEFSFAGDGSDYVRLEAPRVDTDCCDYSADAVKFVDTDAAVTPTVSIKNAHYYTWHDADEDGELDSNENIYLINFVDSDADNVLDTREYYRVDNTDGNDIVEDGELFAVTDTAEQDLIKPKVYDEDGNFVAYKTDAEDLQNFANWYQYYRRRELTAKAVVASAINSLGGVSIGLYTINSGVRQPVLPIKLDMAASRNYRQPGCRVFHDGKRLEGVRRHTMSMKAVHITPMMRAIRPPGHRICRSPAPIMFMPGGATGTPAIPMHKYTVNYSGGGSDRHPGQPAAKRRPMDSFGHL